MKYHVQILNAILTLLILTTTAYADPYTDAKIGWCKMANVKGSMVEEVEAGYKWDKWSVGLSFSNWIARCGSGDLYVYPFMLSGKYSWANWYVGGGIGKAFMDFDENYVGQADTESSNVASVIVGWQKDWFFVEGKRLWGDLNIESGSPSQGILEDYSRLDSIQVLLGARFRF